MSFTPYPHQVEGIKILTEKPAVGLFWGLGTGKTITSLTAVNDLLYDLMEPGPCLVIAPKMVALSTWSKEAEKWPHLSHLRVIALSGTAQQRRTALATPADVYVIGRDLVCWLVEEVGNKWPFKIVILDELTSFKNPQAKRWKALRRVRGRINRVIGLTGTPRPNSVQDLWAQLYLLDQGERLGRTLTAFRQRYLLPDKRNGNIVYSYVPREGAEKEIYERIGDICYSLRKEDVLSLPGQVYENVELTPPPALLKKYKQFEREKVLECLDGNGDIIAGTEAALLGKLTQFAGGSIYDMDGQAHHIHDVKLDALEELVEQAGGDPILVLYGYKHEAERIKTRIPCRTLETSADIDAWNRKEIPVALAHPASVAFGVNLQEGGHLTVWYTPTFSLELWEQANQRMNRPGQKHVCIVYTLVMKGTVDEKILAALERKESGQRGAIEALKLEVTKEATIK